MAFSPARDLRIGTIVEETLGVLERCWRPAAIFVAAMTVINGSAAYFALDRTAIMQQLAKGGFTLVVGIIGAYLLLGAMLRRMGYVTRPASDDLFIAYFGLSIVYTLGVMLGLLLLIVPGLFVIARWIVAQPLLLARGAGIKAALQESWERTRGNEFSILVAMLALLAVFIGITVLVGRLYEKTDPVGVFLSQLASSAISAVSAAMGVALYGLIIVAADKASEGRVDPRIGA